MTLESGGIVVTILLICVMLLVIWHLQISEFYKDTTLTCTTDNTDSNNTICLKESTDISNTTSTVIELIVGIFAGLVIAVYLYYREIMKKRKRGEILTLVLLDYLIPLRKSTNELIERMKKKNDENYELIGEDRGYYENLKEYRLRINPLMLMSSDSIDTHHQLSLLKITNILDMKTPFDTSDTLIILRQLSAEITDYLQENSTTVKKALELKNDLNRKKLRELNKPHLTESEQVLKKRHEEQIKINTEFVKDIFT